MNFAGREEGTNEDAYRQRAGHWDRRTRHRFAGDIDGQSKLADRRRGFQTHTLLK